MKAQFVVCIDYIDYPDSLVPCKIYRVLPDDEGVEYGCVRLIDKSGEDYLYYSEYFVPIEVPQVVEEALLRMV